MLNVTELLVEVGRGVEMGDKERRYGEEILLCQVGNF